MKNALLAALCFLLPLMALANESDTLLIKTHLSAITKTSRFRNYADTAQLNRTATYIQKEFEKHSTYVFSQDYSVEGKGYKNIICSFGPHDAPRIIVGAHYDVCGNQEGADDNASGIAGLLELARLLKDRELHYRIDLVAYTLEEPPYFRTQQMGSYVHAKSLADDHANVYGMISLEMIGYFKDEKGTQSYPVSPLKLIYGSRGNYITLVRKFHSGKFARKFAKNFRNTHTVRTKKFTAPSALPGIDFSDHLNYWKFHFSALMITDTAFFRNKGYHEITDKMENLDIARMAKVINGVYNALSCLN